MTSVRLPDVEDKVRGIVAIRTDSVTGRTRYTLQCERCLTLETLEHLVLMQTRFHTRGGDRRRLCPNCRRELFPDCTCDGCKTDRTGSMYP